MNFKILFSVILVTLLTFSSLSVAKASSQTVMVLSDTYVEAQAASSAFGQKPYLEVADSEATISLAFLMFNLSGVSYKFNASSEIKLRLRCLNVTSLHVICVRWCLNNTWNEDNLAFNNISDFVRSEPESYVSVSSREVWYEWTITNIVHAALEGGYGRLTLVLEVASSHTGYDYVFFYSREASSASDYSPYMVFTYVMLGANTLDTVLEIVFASIVVIVIIFVAYRFSRKSKKEKYRTKSRFHHKSVRNAKK